MNPTTLTAKQLSDIEHLWRSGMRPADIARETGASYTQVYRRRPGDVPLPPRPVPGQIRWAEDGFPIGNLTYALETGLSHNEIRELRNLIVRDETVAETLVRLIRPTLRAKNATAHQHGTSSHGNHTGNSHRSGSFS
jgi:hypothetical protein